MKAHIQYLIIFFLALIILNETKVSAQACINKTDKTIIDSSAINSPCATDIARDKITLGPGFDYAASHQAIPKTVRLIWNYSASSGWTPSLTLNSTTYVGNPLSSSPSFNEFISSIGILTNKLPSGWSVSTSPTFSTLVTVLISNFSDFSFSGNYNYNGSSITQNYVPASWTFDAKVDEKLIFDLSSDYLASENQPPANVNTSGVVGCIQGVANVTPSGGGTYNIPIFTSPGTAGMQPSISIVYNSQGGSGLLGQGWDIAGLSAITRVPQSKYTDGKMGGVNLDADDRFALDGNRLLALVGTYGIQGTTYETQTMTFSKIETPAFGNSYYFKVSTKDGKIIEYGNTDDSRAMASGSSVPYMWRMNKITDANHNFMTFTYHNENGESVIDHIDYTGNTTAGVDPYNQIQFYYYRRDDKNTLYIGGASIAQTLLLRQVKSICEGKTVRTYSFEYTKCAFNATQNIFTETHLNKVAVTGSDGNTLNPTIINWGAASVPYSNNPNNQNFFYQKTLFSGDFDGDGRTDYFTVPFHDNGQYSSADKWQLYLTNADGKTFRLADEGNLIDNLRGVEIADLNNDGKDEVFLYTLDGQCAYPDNTWICRTLVIKSYNGSKLADTENWQEQFANADPLKFQSGDFDGDGKLDYFFLDNSNEMLNPEFSSDKYAWEDFNYPDKVISMDFNGNGKKDLLTIKGTNCTIYEDNNTVHFAQLYNSSTYPTSSHRIFTGDFNGDGKTDLLTYSTVTHNWEIAYSTGTGFTTPIPAPITKHVDPETDSQDYNYTTADFNGDGKTDILECYHFGSSFTINIYYSTGNGFVKEVATTTADIIVLTGKSCYDKFDDLNGDGKADIYLMRNGNDEILTFHDNEKSEFVSSITNGYNQTFSYTHESLSTGNVSYTKGTGSVFPVKDVQKPKYVVSTFIAPDGIGGSSTTTYSYAGLKEHMQGLGTLGFSSVSATNTVTDRKVNTATTFDVTGTNPSYNPSTSSSTVVVNSTSKAIQTSSTSFVSTQPVSTSKAWFSYPSTTTETNNLTGVSVNTTNNYNGGVNGSLDLNGNIYITTKDYGGGLKETTTYENYVKAGSYIKADGSNMLSKPTKITVTRRHPDEGVDFSNQTNYTYDATNGNILTTTANANLASLKQVTTSYNNSYNAFGSPLSVTTSSYSEGNPDPNTPLVLTKSFTYEPKGRFIESVTDPMLVTTQYMTEPVFGSVVYEKASNLSNPTTSVFDAWGTVTSKTLPDGNSMSTSLNWSTDLGASKPLYYTYTTYSDGDPWGKTWYDASGRILRTETVGFNSISKYAETKYKTTGQVDYKASGLGTTQTSKVTYTYKPDGRVDIETNNITSATISYGDNYGINKVTTTSDGKTYTKTYDNCGNLQKSEEPGGATITYKYKSNGKPASITSPVSTITMGYDDLGQQTSLIDPDAGTSTYRYDALGRLTYQKIPAKDGNFFETYLKYDALGRLNHKENNTHALTYQYEYCTTNDGSLGKLSKSIAPNSTYQSYTYDPLGRVLTSTEYIDANNIYTYINTYNSAGYITTVQYPDGSKVNKQYDNATLKKVSFVSADNAISTDVWTLNTLNATTMAYALGNGVATTKSYDASKGFNLSSIVSTMGATQIQNNTYDFNKINGTLNSRQDARTGYALKETFGYDNLYRLNSWVIAQNGTTTNSYSLNYKPDNSGNIDIKTGIGTYNFNITGKPHRVSGVLLSSPSALPTTVQDINYTDFNKISDITENNYNLTFTYGPDQERVTSVMKQGGSNQYTMYYGGMYEKKVMADGSTTQYIYISGGDGIAAVYIKPAGTGSLYYIHKDHLGSITTLTNISGTIAEQYAFDPWGRRRNFSDWSFTNVPAPTLLTRGFTGHEHINELNLINMNGRMYDPLLGMFLSPDNFVQAPSSSQSYNRYSYCMGNPLMYTDPSGNTWLSKAWSWAKEHKEDIVFSMQDPTYLLGRLDTDKDWSVKQALNHSLINTIFFYIPYKIYNSRSDNPNYNIDLDTYLNGRPDINGDGDAIDEDEISIQSSNFNREIQSDIEKNYYALVDEGRYSEAVDLIISSYGLDKEVQGNYSVIITNNPAGLLTTEGGIGQPQVINIRTGALNFNHFGTIVRVTDHELTHVYQKTVLMMGNHNEREFLAYHRTFFANDIPAAQHQVLTSLYNKGVGYYNRLPTSCQTYYQGLYQDFLNFNK